MALADILKLITTKAKKRSAADLRATLAEIDPKALEAEVDRLEAQRRRLLVHGSDAEVLAIGAEITAANLACERGAAAIEELNRLIAEADQREAEAAIETTVAEAEKAGRQIADTATEVDVATGALAALLGKLSTQTATLRSLNGPLEKAGRQVAKAPDIKVIRRRVIDRLR